MKRLRHYFSRLATLDLRNMMRVAGAVATESGKPRFFILADMVLCSMVYQGGYLDYQEFEFWSLTAAERRTWITTGRANSIVVKYNRREFRQRFIDKIEFNTIFGEFLGRRWLDVRTTDAADLAQFIRSEHTVMVKKLDGLGGAGIHKVRASEIDDFDALRRQLVEGRQFLVEGFIDQHPAMTELSGLSVSSLRIITFLKGNDVHVLEAVLRMGNRAEVDNYAQGGMYTVIDEQTGVAHHGAFDQDSSVFIDHPQSGQPIVGFTVPEWPRVLELIDAAARLVPEIPYVGWDVAIARTGPVLIEGNYNTGVFQMKPSLTGDKTGLLPKFQHIIDF